MKKVNIAYLSIALFLTCTFSAGAQAPSVTDIFTINMAVTNMAANTTNSTAGVKIPLPSNGEARSLMIMGRAEGIAATTNGITGVSNIVLRLSISQDGTNFSYGATSPYFVTIPAPGYTTNYSPGVVLSLPGILAIKATVQENNTFGMVSNLNLMGSYNH